MTLNRVLFVACAALLAGPAVAAELTVGCNADYGTIQAAVDAANPGDTITVCPGTYAENVFVGKNGLTIQSTEIPERGPNTIVDRFQIGWAPNVGPSYVTIKGFTVNGNQVCIESSGDYNTIAFNRVTNCGNNAAIRVNQGNLGNNVHHNFVDDVAYAGILIEGYYGGCCGGTAGPGENHNIHHNKVIDAGGEGCYYIWADNSEVHQNEAADCVRANAGINAIGSDGLHMHHNVICGSISMWSAVNGYLHHNLLTGYITNENNPGPNRLRRNEEDIGDCPVDDNGI